MNIVFTKTINIDIQKMNMTSAVTLKFQIFELESKKKIMSPATLKVCMKKLFLFCTR